MLRKRDHFGLVEGANGGLLAIGGWDGSHNRSSCESYSPVEDKWHMCPSLAVKRSGHAYCSSSWGDVYALSGWGGSDLISYLAGCEVLYAAEGVWHTAAIPDLDEGRHCPSAAACVDGYIYFAGGSAGGTLSSVLRLDLTTVLDEEGGWVEMEPMLHPRYKFALVALDGALFAIGGVNGIGVTKTVEMYDVQTDEWRMVASMTWSFACLLMTSASVTSASSWAVRSLE